MLNRVGSPKPVETPQQAGQSVAPGTRPGPSPHSAHPTGPAPPFEYEEEAPQTDFQAGQKKLPSGEGSGRN